MLHRSPADISRRVLIDLGVGTLPTDQGLWPIFAGAEPNLPDNCITLTDTTGTQDGRSMVTGESFSHMGIQFRVRATDDPTAWAKMEALKLVVEQGTYQKRITFDGYTFLVQCFSRIGNIIGIGKDTPTSKRSLLTLNCLITVKEV